MATVDDKSQYCIPFIKECLAAFTKKDASTSSPPFFLGINGIQGAGKTTFVNTLRTTLTRPPFNYRAISFSLDDLYLTHPDQLALARSHSSNPLLQHRGQPGTHDIPLAAHLIRRLKAKQPVSIPVYDKSAFDGEGDRCAEEAWVEVNTEGERPVDVVIVEGWCLGFRKRDDGEVSEEWEDAVQKVKGGSGDGDGKHEYNGRLGHVQLEHVLAINHALEGYDVITDNLDALIHLDAADTHFVYDWRQEQEAHLRAATGRGMTEEKVNAFVDGYYPSYELYTKNLRKGIFNGEGEGEGKQQHRQLRLVIGKDRRVLNHYTI